MKRHGRKIRVDHLTLLRLLHNAFLVFISFTFMCFRARIFVLGMPRYLKVTIDYSGISALMAGGTISAMYFLLHCEGGFRTAIMITLGVVNLVGIIGPMFPIWTRGSFRTWRSLIYISSGGFIVFPIGYYLAKHGFDHFPDPNENPGFVYMSLMLCLYLLGAFFYVNRIPERSGSFQKYLNYRPIPDQEESQDRDLRSIFDIELKLFHYHKVPTYLQDNDYILTG
ncbi:Adiponectin receptor protein 2 [Boothiomyces sp. JEL0838]|nr:Adiponectin receptor protein 2 [Boothiomyces sp. JEL0838]KAJ3314229.1 Adiponectin receptor protein 2 [Boothiomyces sp. JEL0838]